MQITRLQKTGIKIKPVRQVTNIAFVGFVSKTRKSILGLRKFQDMKTPGRP